MPVDWNLTLIVKFPLNALIAASAMSLWEYLTNAQPSDKQKKVEEKYGENKKEENVSRNISL